MDFPLPAAYSSLLAAYSPLSYPRGGVDLPPHPVQAIIHSMRFRSIVTGLLLRRALKELGGIREQLEQHNRLLSRLATRFAAEPPAANAEDIRTLTGIDHVDESELAVIDSYIERTRRQTGREPSEEEIFRYLVDEQTTSLEERFRAEEAARARSGRP